MNTIHATTYFDGDITRGFGVELTTCDDSGTILALDWIPAEGVSILAPIDWETDHAVELLRQHGWTPVGIWDDVTDPRDGAPGVACMVQRADDEAQQERPTAV